MSLLHPNGLALLAPLALLAIWELWRHRCELGLHARGRRFRRRWGGGAWEAYEVCPRCGHVEPVEDWADAR